MAQPVFLVSLPRSGSTLLQKILCSHSRVGSTAEPWILLPLAAMTDEVQGAVYAEYSHSESVRAIRDLVAAMRGGESAYHAALARFAQEVYDDCLQPGQDFFLDKTPRYFLIVDFIYKLFPDAKVIFLFRNPLESLASMMTTWWSGLLKTYHLEMDLREGPRLMAEGYARHRERAHAVHYQDLVESPEATVAGICAYLGVDFEPAMIERYRSADLKGVMGDKKGVVSYARISTESLDKWMGILDNPVRRHYARRLLASYDVATLAAFRLDPPAIMSRLEATPVSYRNVGKDLFWRLVTLVGGRIALDAIRGHLRRKRPYKVD
ncbi:MAG TPA: sulfotransferase [Moraxellaceae bacterium]|nr:sulfotransferase [Moraxellaceae bacterium]